MGSCRALPTIEGTWRLPALLLGNVEQMKSQE